jgi:hypothetical protein
MPRFNTTVAERTRREDESQRVTNLAGGQAYSQSLELELASHVLTSLVQDQFYRSADNALARLRELIAACDPKYVAQLALYARRSHNLRSISHVLAGELAADGVDRGDWGRRFYSQVVARPDDITEILAYAELRYGKPLRATGLLKGLAGAFAQFDTYQLARYRGSGKGVSLVDAVNLTHPKPTERNAEALAALVADRLRDTQSWEAEASKSGDAKATLAGQVREGKLGYMALVRNLRNLLALDDAEVMEQARAQLVDPARVKRSRMLPFRYFTASQELAKLPSTPEVFRTQQALSAAAELALENVPDMPGRNVVMIDTSGSMGGPVSGRSEARRVDIAALFGAILWRKTAADVVLFASDAHWARLTDQGVLSAAQVLRGDGGATNLNAAFDLLGERAYDRIVILSDMQAWVQHDGAGTTWGPSYGIRFDGMDKLRQYEQRSGAQPFVHSIDLAGYGSMQFPERRIAALAGFSERVFDLMQFAETDREALIQTIKAIEI